MAYRSSLVRSLTDLKLETPVLKIMNNVELWEDYDAKIALVNRADSSKSDLAEELWIGKDFESIKKFRSNRNGHYGGFRKIEDLGVSWNGLYVGFSTNSSQFAMEIVKNIEFYFDERMFGHEDFAKLLVRNPDNGFYYDSSGRRLESSSILVNKKQD